MIKINILHKSLIYSVVIKYRTTLLQLKQEILEKMGLEISKAVLRKRRRADIKMKDDSKFIIEDYNLENDDSICVFGRFVKNIQKLKIIVKFGSNSRETEIFSYTKTSDLLKDLRYFLPLESGNELILDRLFEDNVFLFNDMIIPDDFPILTIGIVEGSIIELRSRSFPTNKKITINIGEIYEVKYNLITELKLETLLEHLMYKFKIDLTLKTISVGDIVLENLKGRLIEDYNLEDGTVISIM